MSVSETPALKLQINDSDAIHRSDLTERLSACGYAVVEASDGEEGFNVLVRDQPDAVVTELCMSPVDGWDFMRRARTVRPLMPTIILTEDTSEDTLLKALRMGVCDFLRKGTAVRAIDRAVRAAVEGVPTARRFREETRDIIGTSDSIEGLRLKIDKIGT
ncbi:MAG: response regulator, partial [Myxococcota bacterium]